MIAKNRKFGWKAIISLIALFVGISPGLVHIGYVLAQTVSYVVSSGGMVKGSSYTILTSGSTYYAIDGNTGVEFKSGSDASAVLQLGLNALSGGGKIFIKRGTYDLTSKLTVSYDNIIIEGEGQGTYLQLANRVSEDLFSVEASQCVIRDLQLYGNKDTNTVGSGIAFKCPPTKFVIEKLTVENLIIYKFIGAGVNGTGSEGHLSKFLYVKNCQIVNNTDGIYLDAYSWAAWIEGNNIYYSTNKGINVQASGEHRFEMNYLWENRYGIGIANAYEIQFTTTNVADSQRHGVLIESSHNLTFSNTLALKNSRESSGSYDGIALVDSEGIVIVTAITQDTLASMYQSWGVKEYGTSNYNTFIGISALRNVNGGIKKLGVNTHVNVSWNGTTWIT